jgi:hypothetical protein
MYKRRLRESKMIRSNRRIKTRKRKGKSGSMINIGENGRGRR